jgi:hypothetical protein
MKNNVNKYTFKRKVYGIFTVVFLVLSILSFFISQILKNGVFEFQNINSLLGIISYGFLLLTSIFLKLEINTSDREVKENQ